MTLTSLRCDQKYDCPHFIYNTRLTSFFSQVNDLTQVFRDVFSFDVKEVNLGHVNTQLQLEGEINTWAWENDDPDNLLIVYYAGHGIFDHRKKVLELTP